MGFDGSTVRSWKAQIPALSIGFAKRLVSHAIP
jgi:hypothetical protein